MIKNDRQYQAARRAADQFAATLAGYPAEPPPNSDVHPRFWAAERDAIAVQLEELHEDLQAYDDLRTGARRVIEIGGWSDVPRTLIEGRIAANLTQRELAERLGVAEQAIQRYEATDYASASLKRLQEVADAIGLSVAGLAAVPESAPTPERLIERIKELGVTKEWVADRLLPEPTAVALFGAYGLGKSYPVRYATASADKAQSIGTALVQAAEVFRRVFDVDPGHLFGPSPLALRPALAGQTRFKRPAKKSAKGADAYTFYAHYLALLTLQACSHLARQPLPRTGRELGHAVRERYGSLTLEYSLRFVWEHGIPVLPLIDVGAFHGACWRAGGREVIALKQRTASADRWMYDLWHEVGHIVEEPEGEAFAIIEEEVPPADDPREQQAAGIAGDVVLDGRADELAERAMELVDNNVPRLDRVVARVAQEARVSVGALANHLAFRIAQDSDGKIKWWSTAAKFQETGGDPWQIARDVLLEYADFGHLNPGDRDLLVRALSEPAQSARGA